MQRNIILFLSLFMFNGLCAAADQVHDLSPIQKASMLINIKGVPRQAFMKALFDIFPETIIKCGGGAIDMSASELNEAILKVDEAQRVLELDDMHLQRLIAAIKELNQGDTEGNTPLHVICSFRSILNSEGDSRWWKKMMEVPHDSMRLAIIRSLVEERADVNAIDKDGNTPVFLLYDSYPYHAPYISHAARAHCTRYLIEQRAEVNHRNKGGKSLLSRAVLAMETDSDLIRYLLEQGGDINQGEYPFETWDPGARLHSRSGRGTMLTAYAALLSNGFQAFGEFEDVFRKSTELLLQKGDCLMQSTNGDTALSIARENLARERRAKQGYEGLWVSSHVAFEMIMKKGEEQLRERKQNVGTRETFSSANPSA